jgi:hypothetical protein
MKTKRHLAIEIFELMLSGTDRDKKHAANLILKLNDVERRDLRAACQNLDALVEETWMAEMREQRIEKQKKS